MKYKRNEIAKEFDIGIETLRHYENLELLPPPERDSNGYRVYSEEHFHILKFIVKAKRFGFSLKEIRFFIDIFDNTKPDREEIKEIVNKKIETIESQISELNELKDLLEVFSQSENLGNCNTFRNLKK